MSLPSDWFAKHSSYAPRPITVEDLLNAPPVLVHGAHKELLEKIGNFKSKDVKSNAPTNQGGIMLLDISDSGISENFSVGLDADGCAADLDSDELVRKTTDALRPGVIPTQLLVYHYVPTGIGSRDPSEGLNFAYLEGISRILGLEVDLLIPHTKWRSREEVKGVQSRFSTGMTILHLAWTEPHQGGEFRCTSQVCRNKISQDYALVAAIFRDCGLPSGRHYRESLTTYLGISPWQVSQVTSDTFEFMLQDRERLLPFYLTALKSMAPETYTKHRRNPFEVMVPFIRTTAGAWLYDIADYSEKFRRRQDEMDFEAIFASLDVHDTCLVELRKVQYDVATIFGSALATDQHPVILDFARVIERSELLYRSSTEFLSYKASMESLEESKLAIQQSKISIQQNQSVKRLTQLAFVFIPLSFITSVFGMNVDVLTGNGTKWWTVIVGAAIIYLLTAIGLGLVHLQRLKEWFYIWVRAASEIKFLALQKDWGSLWSFLGCQART